MSGRKNVLASYQTITNGTMGGNLTSIVTNAQYQDNIGMQVKWTSSDAVGVIAVEASINGSDYYALTFNPALTQPSSDNGGYLIDINQFPFIYYRITYTRTSGTGTFNAWVTSKEI